MSFDPMSPGFYVEGQQAEKDNTIARFYMRPVQSAFKSNEAGHPVFVDTEYVEVIIPGNRGTTLDTPARDEHKARWPQQYERFKAGQEEPTEGTPVGEWAGCTRSEAEELKYLHVRTVEMLANLDDAAIQKMSMGGLALRERARRFLAQAQGSAPADALAAKVAEQADMMADMQRQIEALLAQAKAGPEAG